jgi:anti-sigma regulatory factor (Ser/Thr protein kinase)
MEKRILITRWFGADRPIPIYDEASVSSARERVRETGNRANLSKDTIESVALMASELTHNHLSHARHGYFAVRPVERDGVHGLEIVAADIGPGIQKPGNAIKDEIPSNGHSLRAGLAAVYRLADEVEFDNRISEGSCIVARKFDSRPTALCCEVAIMGRALSGEPVSGDDAFFSQSSSEFIAAVCDGLGHGPEAREASNKAIDFVSRKRDMDLSPMPMALNEELVGTRGCVMSFMRFQKDDRVLQCASVGDLHSHLYYRRDAHFFTSTPIVLGGRQFQPQRVRTEQIIAERGAVLVVFTDGLKSSTSLKGQLDVLRQPAIAIAQHLLENHARSDDDAMVLVARFLE